MFLKCILFIFQVSIFKGHSNKKLFHSTRTMVSLYFLFNGNGQINSFPYLLNALFCLTQFHLLAAFLQQCKVPLVITPLTMSASTATAPAFRGQQTGCKSCPATNRVISYGKGRIITQRVKPKASENHFLGSR